MSTRAWLCVMTAFAIGYALGDMGDALEIIAYQITYWLFPCLPPAAIAAPWACC